MTQEIYCKQAKTISDVLVVRRIRNECRTFLTNYSGHISIPRQIYWYFSYYRQAANSGVFQLIIASNPSRLPVGYGVLSLINKELYVTECVAEKYRGQGYGSAILKHLISVANKQKLPIVAEIWASNQNSIALHKKYKFVQSGSKMKSGSKLLVFRRSG